MNNNDKFHFFIGNIFNNEEQIQLLKNIQKKIRKKYGLKEPHWNNKFFTNLIYIGYFNNKTASLYMENIISPLLNAISSNFDVLECNYTNFKIDYDKTFYKISLKFNDINNYLENIIIPYLHENAILPIYDKKYILKPSIDLIYYKDSYKLLNKDHLNIEIPKDKFYIDHISLIKGTPVKYRVGTPSLHDQMILEEVSKYTFPLKI